MNWQGKKVLITGAGGFIGSHLTECLVRKGANVYTFIRYNSRNDDGYINDLPLEIKECIFKIYGDLRDPEAVRSAMNSIDTIFHLGALIAIPYSYIHPREVIETNIMGTLNVLMAARDVNVRRIIHTSTSEVYGSAQYVPIDENHPLKGQSPYSASKIGADKIAESFYKSYNLPVVILRPFNTYGPRQSARAVIPTIITQALSSDEIHLGSLDPERDFTYVEDTVKGYILAASADKIIGEEVNLGTGEMVSIGKLTEIIFSILNKSPHIILDSQRQRPEKSEVMRLQSSYHKAFSLMGWKPTASLQDGLTRTIEWIKINLNRYKINEYNI